MSGADGQILRTHFGGSCDYEPIGNAVLAIKDLDRDQIPDYLVGGPAQGDCDFVGVIAFSGDNGVLLYETEMLRGIGLAEELSDVGDVNGDRVNDFAVRYYNYTNVHSGRDGQLLHYTDSVLPGLRGRSSSATVFQDLNGDGFMEWLQGTGGFDTDSGPFLGGRIQVKRGRSLFFWSTHRVVTRDFVLERFGLRLRGPEPNAPAAVILETVNGVDFGKVLFLGRLDQRGAWDLPRISYPDEFPRLDFVFRAYSVSNGAVIESGTETVSIDP